MVARDGVPKRRHDAGEGRGGTPACAGGGGSCARSAAWWWPRGGWCLRGVRASPSSIWIGQVVREHDPSGRDVELFRRHLYSGGKGPTVKGLKGAELADGLFIKEGDYKLVKTRFSAFFATHLDSVLKTLGMKNLVIVGVQTPNCIRQTIYDAVALDYEKVTVLTDATAAARPDIHLASIRDMKTIGMETPTLEEWRR